MNTSLYRIHNKQKISVEALPSLSPSLSAYTGGGDEVMDEVEGGETGDPLKARKDRHGLGVRDLPS